MMSFHNQLNSMAKSNSCLSVLLRFPYVLALVFKFRYHNQLWVQIIYTTINIKQYFWILSEELNEKGLQRFVVKNEYNFKFS